MLQPMTPDPARPPSTEDPPYILKLPINRKADVMLNTTCMHNRLIGGTFCEDDVLNTIGMIKPLIVCTLLA